MLAWAAPAGTSSCFHHPLALVTCFPPDISPRLLLPLVSSLHLPVKMLRLCSRNTCSLLSLLLGLALHHITHLSCFFLLYFQRELHSSFSPSLRLPHNTNLLLCSGPQKGLDGLPALSTKDAAVTITPPWTHQLLLGPS